ncbi:hypothetical protein [Phormidium sp. CCY1219]|uniref:hypothetical protein n=1 Tax=Phormidium sp. CCY1219 TaxID=2886104 RepID=UPI002D1F178A|nr:hypothetical protein [Phormidium sp. CCY1219]MEB3828520.1 hypothetical protein [Phormidium sp. CCY1219]
MHDDVGIEAKSSESMRLIAVVVKKKIKTSSIAPAMAIVGVAMAMSTLLKAKLAVNWFRIFAIYCGISLPVAPWLPPSLWTGGIFYRSTVSYPLQLPTIITARFSICIEKRNKPANGRRDRYPMTVPGECFGGFFFSFFKENTLWAFS